MNLPKEFDNAKNDLLLRGYESRFFRPKQCPECKHFVEVEGWEGCGQGDYLVPLAAESDRTCKNYKGGVNK